MSKAIVTSPKSLASFATNTLSDQGYTYNEPGLTYNQIGVTYGGADRNSSPSPINNRAFISSPRNRGAVVL